MEVRNEKEEILKDQESKELNETQAQEKKE